MNLFSAGAEPFRVDWQDHASRSAQWSDAWTPPIETSVRDVQFLALQADYRTRGGVARGEVLAARRSLAGCGTYIDLARSIVDGQLFSFYWHDTFWLPMFQFDPDSLTTRDRPRQVLGELGDVYDGWEMAHWHVRPHASLQGQCPLDLLESDLPAVLAAARADRRARAG